MSEKKIWKKRLSDRVAQDLKVRIIMVRGDQEAMHHLSEISEPST